MIMQIRNNCYEEKYRVMEEPNLILKVEKGFLEEVT